MSSKQIGDLGESIAEKYLKNKGYRILDRNYLNSFASGPLRGEIDIVAKQKDLIVFVEVKTLDIQDRHPLISPEEKVDYLKQKKLIKTAESWLMEKKIPLDDKWQIDVISIKIDLATQKAKIRHFQNAVF